MIIPKYSFKAVIKPKYWNWCGIKIHYIDIKPRQPFFTDMNF